MSGAGLSVYVWIAALRIGGGGSELCVFVVLGPTHSQQLCVRVGGEVVVVR